MEKLGAILRQQRERKGLDLAQVEADTKIRRFYLEALEEGLWERIPGEVYRKGFLRSYGEYLGLDGDDLVRRYKRLREAQQRPEQPHRQQPEQAQEPEASPRQASPGIAAEVTEAVAVASADSPPAGEGTQGDLEAYRYAVAVGAGQPTRRDRAGGSRSLTATVALPRGSRRQAGGAAGPAGRSRGMLAALLLLVLLAAAALVVAGRLIPGQQGTSVAPAQPPEGELQTSTVASPGSGLDAEPGAPIEAGAAAGEGATPGGTAASGSSTDTLPAGGPASAGQAAGAGRATSRPAQPGAQPAQQASQPVQQAAKQEQEATQPEGPGMGMPANQAAVSLPLEPVESVILTVTVRERSWLEVAADGRRLFARNAEAGESHTWQAQEVLQVRFGRSEGVRLVLNGVELGPAGSGTVTRLFTAEMAAEVVARAKAGLPALPPP